MEKEFLKYKEALDLKELGFDEPCLAHFNGTEIELILMSDIDDIDDVKLLSPLWQHAFRWFRKKYNIEGVTEKSESYSWFKYKVYEYHDPEEKIQISGGMEYVSYEEAELACLRRLIEIVKNQ